MVQRMDTIILVIFMYKKGLVLVLDNASLFAYM